MIVVDKLLARVITISVCLYGGVLLGTACIQSLKGYETDGNIKELAYLIVGGLLSQITTRGNKEEPEGTQQVSVPDPLPSPVKVDAAPVEEYRSEFGHMDLTMLLGLALATACGILLAGVISRAL